MQPLSCRPPRVQVKEESRRYKAALAAGPKNPPCSEVDIGMRVVLVHGDEVGARAHAVLRCWGGATGADALPAKQRCGVHPASRSASAGPTLAPAARWSLTLRPTAG